MEKKYYYNAMAYRLQCYPEAKYFKMFVGQCYIHSIGRAGLLEEILRSHFDKNCSQSERDHLLAKYDESMTAMLLNRWNEIKQRGFTPEILNFLYDKIKYKKVMRLNIGFNEVDFKWSIIAKVFDAVFNGLSQTELNETMIGLNDDLKSNIKAFYDVVVDFRRLVGDLPRNSIK